MSAYDLGDVVRITTTTKVAGVLTDATAVSLVVQKPDLTSETAVTLAAGQVVKDATGTYHYDYTPATAGHYTFRWVTTGTAVGSDESTFDVSPLLAGRIVSLQETKSHLGLTDSTHDDELRRFIAATTAWVERKCTGVVPTTYTAELHDGGGSIFLRHQPVISVATVAEYTPGVATPTTVPAYANAAPVDGYSLDARLGILRRVDAGGTRKGFLAGSGNVAVTYVAGRVPIPDDLVLGGLEAIRVGWQKSQGGLPASAGFDEAALAPSLGEAYRLLGPYLRGPLVA